MSLLIDPLVSFDVIDSDELNWALVKWDHKMGPLNRPEQYGFGAHGLRHNGQLVGVAAWSALIRQNCAGMDFLPRNSTTELSRVCACRSDINRVTLRLWREFAWPSICRALSHEWAVSYQDRDLHSGDLYRFDGWVPLGLFSSGGTDPRTGRKGRKGTVWGWHADPATRAARTRTEKAQRAAAAETKRAAA